MTQDLPGGGQGGRGGLEEGLFLFFLLPVLFFRRSVLERRIRQGRLIQFIGFDECRALRGRSLRAKIAFLAFDQ
ncbi:MAG: hypothetical protein ACOX9B_08505 [Candidatus Xenobium sp.]|jgi:hypothetical protein